MFRGIFTGALRQFSRLFLGAAGSIFVIASSALAADLQISDYSFNPDPVGNGAITTFSIRATNNGPGTVSDAVVTIAVSDRFQVGITPGTDFPSFCSISGAVGSQSLACTLPGIASGADNNFDYFATAIVVGSSSTTATIASATANDTNSGNDSLAISPAVRQGADVVVDITPSAASIPAGGTLTYALGVTNNGPNDTDAVRVTTNLPAASDYQYLSANGTNWSCSHASAVVICDYTGGAVTGALPGIIISGRVIKATTGTVTTQSFIESTNALIVDPDLTNNNAAPVVTTILPGTDLAAFKSMPATIILGTNATITLRIDNTGPQTAPAGATISDLVSSNFTIGAMPAGCILGGQTVTCTAGSLNNGNSETFLIPVTAAIVSGGIETNSAIVTEPAGFTDAETGNNSTSVNFEIRAPEADLRIFKTKGPNPVSAGQNMTSTIRVRNEGPSIANYSPTTPIRVQDTVSADETYVSENALWACTPSGSVIDCVTTGTGTLNIGQEIVLSLITQAGASADLSLSNTACTGGTGNSQHTAGSTNSTPADNNTANDCASRGVVATTESADIEIVKEVSLSAAGPWTQTPALNVAATDASFFIRLTVSNLAGDRARTVNVTDDLPNFLNTGGFTTGFAVVSATQGSPAYTASSGRISWTVTDLDPATSETAIIRVDRPVNSGSFTNTAVASSPNTTELNSANNSSDALLSVAALANVIVNNKTVAPNPIAVGQQATYILSVRNIGANPALNMVVTDTIDPTRFAIIGTPTTTKSGASCAVNTGTGLVTCTMGTFARNETRQVTINVIPLYPFGGAETGFPISHTNNADVSTTTIESDPNNDFDLIHNVAAPTLDLAVTKNEASAAFDPVRFGLDIEYDIRASNFGPSRATGVQILDIPAPPAGYTFDFDSFSVNPVAASGGLTLAPSAGANCVPAGSNLICTPSGGILGPLTQIIFRVVYTPNGVPPSAPLTFANQAQITAAEQSSPSVSEWDAQMANNDVTQTTTVLPNTDLEVVEKVVVTPASPANINQPIEYRIRIRNNGPSTTNRVRVTDDMPSGFARINPVPTVIANGAASVSSINCTGTNNITCYLEGSFPSGAGDFVDITLTARAAYQYSQALNTNRLNTAEILPGLDGAGGTSGAPLSSDGNPSNNSQNATIQIREATLTGTVYSDDDRSDTIGAGEGIGSVSVTISGTDDYGNTIPNRTVITNGSGVFTFDRLPPGSYQIGETQPGTYFDRNETAGSGGGAVDNSSYGSAAAQNTISAITLTPGQNATGYVFQEYARAQLNGYIYRDLNNNGAREGGETGYSPAAFSAAPHLRLTGTDYTGAAVNLTALVNGSGFYQFADVPPSNGTDFTLAELVQPNNASDGFDTNGTGNVVPGSRGRTAPETIIITGVNPGVTLSERNFGELPTSSIAGRVFFDPNGDATRQAGETAGLAGAILTLSGTNDLGQSINCTQTTIATGDYSFPIVGDPDPLCQVLRPGTYTLTETPPIGIDHTGAYIGSAGGSVGAVTGANTAAPGATNFAVTNIVIGADVNATNYNFGENGQGLSGFVYVDSDNNGVRSGTEQGIPGTTITLSGTTATAQDVCTLITCVIVTDAAGAFSFLNVPGSNPTGYTLTQTQPNDFADGIDATGDVSGSSVGTTGNDVFSAIVLGSGEFAMNFSFGEIASAVSGLVYIDSDNSNGFTTGEPTLSGVLITLSGATGAGQDICTYLAALTPARPCTTSTAPDGTYSFADLPGGNYSLTESQPSAYADGAETAGFPAGTVGAGDVIANIALGDGVSGTDYNFGELATVISGRVYIDPERDGVDAGGEQGLGGVTINLVQGGSIIATTSTNPDGSYNFVDLPAGTYSIEQVQPAGYGSSTPNSVSVTVSAGGTQSTDFGETQSSIAGSVFVDRDSDGVHAGSGEEGIANVIVTLSGTNDAGTLVNLSLQTNPDGSFLFDALLSGTYELNQTQPAGYSDGTDSAGSVGGTVGNDVISAIALPVATDAVSYGFGENGQALTGVVYDDLNNNGVQDPGEPGISGVTIILETQSGGAVGTTVTGPDGRYTFGDVEAGDYIVRETQPAGFGDGQENTSNQRSFTVVTDQPIDPVNFGELTGSISGLVFNDTNGNGTKETDEPGIPGVVVALSGIDARGNAITLTTGTNQSGDYNFDALPGGIYTITETQPSGYNDGIDTAGDAGGSPAGDIISNIALGAAQDASGYTFGEVGSVGQLSGAIWLDRNHDRVRDVSEEDQANWTVQLLLDDTLIATTQSNNSGEYSFSNIAPGSGYTVRFINPESGAVYAGSRPNEDGILPTNGVVSSSNPGGATIEFGELTNLRLDPGMTITEQSLPLDPSGVVYNSISRAIIENAIVSFSGPAGFDPDLHLVGGTANVSQLTDHLGAYQFLLQPSAPAGEYTLSVTPPNGTFNPIQPSTILPPCPGPLAIGATPDPFLVSLSDGAPAISVTQDCNPNTLSTAYYLSFVLTPGVSADVLNNNIPIDPILEGAIEVTKVTRKVNVSRGELVPYTITARNTLTGALTGITLTDMMPAGFKYRESSTILDGVSTEPVVTGRELAWPNQDFAAGQEKRIDLLLVIGSGVREGEYTNQAWAVNSAVATRVSNIAEATVRIIPDPDFDCTDILGKVFDDRNVNGVQDKGEPGLPGVRLVTVRGLLVTTDSFGRYHITCPMIANEDRGSNFILKLDTRTLPSGYRVTTGNPDTVRLTRGKFAKLNFGASLHRVVRLDVTGLVFNEDNLVLESYRENIQTLISTLAAGPSVLRIAYGSTGESDDLIEARLEAITELIKEYWQEDDDQYRLMIEHTVTIVDATTKGDVQ